MVQNKVRISSLPFLIGVYPVLFLYSINVEYLDLNLLWFPLSISILLACLVFVAALAIRKKLILAANSAFVLLFFFFIYGSIYNTLLFWGFFPVKQRYLLPAITLIAVITELLISRINIKNSLNLNFIAWLIISGLIGYNITAAIPIEYQKAAMKRSGNTGQNAQTSSISVDSLVKKPDIYFIILDEFAGPKPMREFWKDNQIDEFITYLRAKGFFVAEESRSPDRNTLKEIASRLNLKDYSNQEDELVLFNAIANNKVMQLLKSYGYTTVYFDGTRESFPSKPAIVADYDLTYSANQTGLIWVNVNDFSIKVLEMTMLKFLAKDLKDNSIYSDHRTSIRYTFDRTADLSDIKSPKFVYTHLLIPHVPFVFDENGRNLNLENPLDWNYYLGQYKFTIKESQILVSRILDNADPNNPPVIILQSDHGARNKIEYDSVVLENYADSYRYDILNALLLPGYDISRLPNDLSPHLTFEIILNFYFSAGVKYEN